MSDLPSYWPASEYMRFPWPGTAFDTSLADRARTLTSPHEGELVAVARTAAWMHGIDTLPPGTGSLAWPAEFHRPPNLTAPQGPAVRTYRWTIRPDQVTELAGVRVTTLDRTLVDCARMLPRLEAVAAADQLLARGADIANARSIAFEQSWPLVHRRRVREVLKSADPKSQSPMESWCRCMIVDAELPRPGPQTQVELAGGSVAFLDLGFEGFRLGAEYDGHRHHSSEADRAHDRARRAEIARAGWAVSVFRSEAVIGDPAQMLGQLVFELRQRGWDPGPGQLERTRKRIRWIAMQRRLERERTGWSGSC